VKPYFSKGGDSFPPFLKGDEGGLRPSLVDKQEELYSFQRAKV
jgi:hypothetical protein